ncbi:MAG: lipid-A-disaccharide synthase-related protein [Deinococcota bacterium]
MARVLFLSNGYGEDSIGSKLARELSSQRPDLTLQAYPTVDQGHAYEGVCSILGPRQVMLSGGLLLHSLDMFVKDMRAGFVGMTLRQLRDLKKLETDILIVVGDVYALSLSLLVNTKIRVYVQPLVSAHHQASGHQASGHQARGHQASGHRLIEKQLSTPTKLNRVTMEKFTSLERYLIRTKVNHMYVRDALTAQTLNADGLGNVQFLGNPMLDGLAAKKPLELHKLRKLAYQPNSDGPIIALLPGTREYAVASLEVMLAALEHVPNAIGIVAWAGKQLPQLPDWHYVDVHVDDGTSSTHNLAVLQHGTQRVLLYQARFNDVLAVADLVLGTAGTAHEQAASLGIPVVSFALPPHYTPAFLANQQRLLADALTISNAEPETLGQILDKLWQDGSARARAADIGRTRMGQPGGSSAITTDILRRWDNIARP